MIDDLERAITSVKCVSHNEGNLNSFIIFGRFFWIRKSTGIFAWYRFNYIQQKNTTFEGCCWFGTNLICTKAGSKKLDSVQITAKQGRSYCINQDFSTLFCICLSFYYLLFIRKVELELGAKF